MTTRQLAAVAFLRQIIKRPGISIATLKAMGYDVQDLRVALGDMANRKGCQKRDLLRIERFSKDQSRYYPGVRAAEFAQ